jgi:hypothetical protein
MSTRPPQVNWSILVQWVALGIGPVVTALDWDYLLSRRPIQESLLDAAVTLLIHGFFIWKMWQRRNWARITLLVLFLIGLPFYYSYLRGAFGRSAILAATSLLQPLVQGSGLFLAFTEPATEWFRKPAVAVNA